MLKNQYVPHIINLELTNKCNLRCVFCDHPTLKKTMRLSEMEDSMLASILEGVKDSHIFELGLVGLGEPLMNKSLSRHLSIIGDYKKIFKRISLNSNGNLLNKSHAELILRSSINLVTFSLNATNRETYHKMMGLDLFDRTVANINSFLEMRLEMGRTDLSVSIQFMSSDLNDIASTHKLFEKYLNEQVIVYNRYIFHKPVLEGTSQNLVNINKADFSNRHPCWSMYSRVYIDIDGNVYPCTIGNDSYRANSGLNLGNVTQKNLLDIFNDKVITEMRSAAEGMKELPQECKSCTAWALFPNNFVRDQQGWKLQIVDEVRRKDLDRI